MALILGVPGVVLRFGLDRGVLLKPRNPYPSLRVILAEKGIHCYGFFLKNRPIFHKFCNFGVFAMRKPKNLGSVRKLDPRLRIFLKKKKNGTHVLRISCRKAILECPTISEYWNISGVPVLPKKCNIYVL